MSYRDVFKDAERDAFWSMPRIFLMLLVASILLYALGFVMTGGDLFIYKFWAPKMENAKREVFENTQSYVQGKVEYIGRLRFQYQTAEGPQKEALKTLILSEASTVDNTKLPLELQAFIGGLK